MRAVFSQAELVYIWLGLGCDETDRVMDWISPVGPRAFSSQDHDHDEWAQVEINGRIRHHIESMYSSSEERQLVENDADDWVPERSRFLFDLNERGLHSDTMEPCGSEDDLAAGILNLMWRDYWCRIWIIQEISVGKDATVLCGAKAVPLDLFDATLSAVEYCSGLTRLHPDIQSFGQGLVSTFFKSVAFNYAAPLPSMEPGAAWHSSGRHCTPARRRAGPSALPPPPPSGLAISNGPQR